MKLRKRIRNLFLVWLGLMFVLPAILLSLLTGEEED